MRFSAMTQRPITSKEQAYIQSLRPNGQSMISVKRQEEEKWYSMPYRHLTDSYRNVDFQASMISKYNYVGVP
jgi:hypothetical protein